MKSTVLLAISISTHFVELSRVAHLLSESGEYEPVVWFQNYYASIERDLAECEANGWRYVAPPRKDTTAKPVRSPTVKGGDDRAQLKKKAGADKPFRRMVLKVLPQTLLFVPLVTWRFIELRYQTRHYNRLLDTYKPRLLVVAEDSYLYLMIKTAQIRGIPTVIIPFTIANASEPAEAYYDRPDHIVSASIINRLIGRKYPN